MYKLNKLLYIRIINFLPSDDNNHPKSTPKEEGALHETDALIEFANITNRKFEKFISTLSEEKRKEYITERNEAEDFFFRYSASTQDEKKRTQKFLESLQNKR